MRNAWVLALLLWCGLAQAAPARVAIVRSPHTPSTALAYLTQELKAAGFAVMVVEHNRQLGPRAQVARRPPGVVATVLLIPANTDKPARDIDIWVGDHASAKTSVRRIRTGGGARTIAIRAVELLQASLLELAASSPPPPHPRPPAVAATPNTTFDATAHAAKPWPQLFSRPTIALAPALLISDGFGTAFSGTISLSYPLPLWSLSARLTVSSVLFPRQHQTSAGTLTLPQQLFTLDLVKPLSSGRLVPLVGTAMGLHHLRSEQRGPNTFPIGEDRYAFAAGVLFGVAARLSNRVALLADAHLLALAPQPAVNTPAGEKLASGQPLSRFGLGVLGAF